MNLTHPLSDIASDIPDGVNRTHLLFDIASDIADGVNLTHLLSEKVSDIADGVNKVQLLVGLGRLRFDTLGVLLLHFLSVASLYPRDLLQRQNVQNLPTHRSHLNQGYVSEKHLSFLKNNSGIRQLARIRRIESRAYE